MNDDDRPQREAGPGSGRRRSGSRASAVLALLSAAVLGAAAALVWADIGRAERAFQDRAQQYFEQVSDRLDVARVLLDSVTALVRNGVSLEQAATLAYLDDTLAEYPQVSALFYASDEVHPDAPLTVDFRRLASLGGRMWAGKDLSAVPGLAEHLHDSEAARRPFLSAPLGEAPTRFAMLCREVFLRRPQGVLCLQLDGAGLFAPGNTVDETVHLRVVDRRGPGVGGQPFYKYAPRGAGPASSLIDFEFTRPVALRWADKLSVSARAPLSAQLLRWDIAALVASIGLLIAAVWLRIARVRARSAHQVRQAEAREHLERERAEVTLHSITDAVLTTDVEGRIDYLNPAGERLLAVTLEEVRGRDVDDVLQVVDERNGRARNDLVRRCLQHRLSIKPAGELSLVDARGGHHPVVMAVSPIRDVDGSLLGSAAVFQDVSADREMSHRLAYQASHDELTGLFGRREFEHRVDDAIQTAGRDGHLHAVCYMDLDQFKVVNDTCGHIAGDALLAQVSAILRREMREKAVTGARLGGDEFGLLMSDIDLHAAVSEVERLIAAIRAEPFVWQDKQFDITASAGVVAITSTEKSVTEIMSYADSACYIAKERGRNRVHVYQADDDDLLRRQGQMQWVHRITQAYNEGRFLLYAQEILPLHDTLFNDEHFEILLRMEDEQGRLIRPSEYVSAAERYNLIADLDRWVIRNSFEAIHRYQEQRRAEPALPLRRFAINLSGQTIGDERVLDFILEQFASYPELPEQVIFEVTETAAVSNLEQATTFIGVLKHAGCRFALDDFGSGVSSFAHLKSLEVDYLKIDGQFVKEIAYDPVNYAMVGSINQVGHVMSIQTIAEYVEDSEIHDKLKEMGVDYGQGNWLREPVPLESLVQDTSRNASLTGE